MRIAHALPVALCAAALGCACSGGDSRSAHPTSAASERAVALSALHPCDLLARDQAAAFGYTVSTHRTMAGTRSCTWSDSPSTETLTITFGTGRIAELEPPAADTTTSHTVGDHRGMRIRAADAPRCTLMFDTGAGGVTSIQAVDVADAAVACERVMHVALLVEPVLP